MSTQIVPCGIPVTPVMIAGGPINGVPPESEVNVLTSNV